MIKLHLGCGGKNIEGFVNIDARDIPGVDQVDNIKTLAKYEENSIDLIYASHVLEHVGRLEYMDVLKRWHQILKVGGILRIAVPDIEQAFNHYQKFGDLMILRGLLWGGQKNAFDDHKIGWDFKIMQRDLKTVGFVDIERYDWRKTEHAHIDDYSQCYLPHMDKENGMLMSLNIEARKK